ncbi:MAG: (2Fe-2S)-binding protein [Planctomycetes bacterium]|nr:(2Fe-2S)-binding protein [Planctomycetota bacterium]
MSQELHLDGRAVAFEDGETLYEVARREGLKIPTLCYDERLEAFGGCRMCVVEVEGIRNPVASCTTRASAGMKVATTSKRVHAIRRTLLELVVSENRELAVDPLRGLASQELSELVATYGADRGRFEGKKSGRSNTEDDNPFILRDYDLCISCYRCVRVCDEQEGDHAISIMNRGFHTQITTEFEGKLSESACTFCGQCVQTCPTGALADKKAIRAESLPGEIKTTRSICPYCGVGCSVDLMTKGDSLVGIRPAMDGPANEGALCIKGQFAFDFVQHRERLRTPLVRNESGELVAASWDEALDRAAAGFERAISIHGRHSVYGIASGRAPHEAAYSMQKLMRAMSGAHHIDNCSRA